MKTARELGLERGERDRAFAAESAALHEILDPEQEDLPQDAQERAALLEQINEPAAITFHNEYEIDALAKEILRADDLPPYLRVEVDRIDAEIDGAGPDAAGAKEQLARLQAWRNAKPFPPGSVMYTHGQYLGARGGRATTKRVGRPPEVVRRSRAELAELEAERDQQVADGDRPLGERDSKTGEYRIEPQHVADAFARDPAKASARWLELGEDEREQLLRGESVTGVTPRK